jgi:serine/threonine protein kinase
MMSPEQFRQVRNLFEAALEKDPAAREAFLASAAAGPELLAEVRRLLEAHGRSVAFLDGTLTAPAALRTDPASLEGRRLGPYEILREIGHGGMGAVFLARRADGVFDQSVAIKVMAPAIGAAAFIERFRQEREILAALDHPHIARLFDGGNTEEGWPYFVMEYVDGVPIDQYCDREKLNVSARLRLFLDVCAAVHSAHRQRIVHRDLKPGNILVRKDGAVKLLDFGIAKLFRDGAGDPAAMATRTGLRLMTPEYASPEQIRDEDVTPATDVYALGVVLYELLTGRRPYKMDSRAHDELVRVVCETAPERPSLAALRAVDAPAGSFSVTREGSPVDLQRRLAGDLDAVLLKALAKDPVSRYRSAELLADDLRRHLDGQPVLAAPAGFFARFPRLLRRHGAAAALAAAGIAAAVTGGITVTAAGLLWFAAAVAILALWRIFSDRRRGEALSGSKFFQGFTALLIVASTMVLAHRWLGDASIAAVYGIAAILVFTFLGLAAKLVSWPFRDRWAGRLHLKTAHNRTARNSGFIGLLVMALYFIDIVDRVPVPTPAAYALSIATLGVFLASTRFLFHAEFRERGILVNGIFYPWVAIENCHWEPETSLGPLPLNLGGGNSQRLRLVIRKTLYLRPPAFLFIDNEHREQVNAILARQLGLWPQTAGAVPPDSPVAPRGAA